MPAGFVVDEYADAKLAQDVHCLTLDPQGRVVVSGPGYLRILVGKDKAESALDFRHPPKDGAHGLFWENDDLYCVGDGGLRVFRDVNGGGREKPSQLLYKLRTGSEHYAHAVNRGPDGKLYVLAGDQALIRGARGGCVARLSPDFKDHEIVADGFRNPYGMDWNADGELFTYDSDNERCVSLPWYEYTRLYHVRPGGRHGWLAPQFATTWRCPPYFWDVVPPVVTLGRGSPTGVVCYKHAQFPAHYRGGVFALDWTFGQIHFVKLTRKGDTYEGKAEVFVKSVGDNGFAPTAAAVHPMTGDLYVSIGGRGTRGAVYRIRHPEGLKALDKAEVAKWQARPETAMAKYQPRPSGSRLDEVRSLQKSLGDIGGEWAKGTVWEGYSLRAKATALPADTVEQLSRDFPAKDDRLTRELGRTLAMLEDGAPATLAKVAAMLTATSHPVDDIHHLIVLACLRAPRTEAITRTTVTALLDLDRKLDALKLNRDRNWPLRIAELHVGLASRDKALNTALVSDAQFGRPDHAVFCRARGFDRKRAAEVFLRRAEGKPEAQAEGILSFAWNAELVTLVGELPAEKALPVLRKLRGEVGLDDVILPLLARHARTEDYPFFVQHLDSPRMALVGQCLDALDKLPLPADQAPEAIKLMQALRGLPPGKEEDKLRARVLVRISRHAGEKLASPDSALTWFRKAHPKHAAILDRPDGVDVAAWQKRLGVIEWDKGDVKRGERIYAKASCASCHSGPAALGPDLLGVTGRFSRDDLFSAILQPSKDVSSRYRTTQLTTIKGQTYQGIIVYEAVDSVLMLTGPALSIRLEHTQISDRKLTATSLMPAGLLDALKDEEIADLYQYLKSLGAGR